MKTYFYLFLGISLFFNSCSTADAEKAADEFHKKLDAGEVDYICDHLIDFSESNEDNRESFKNYLEDILAKGKQINRQKTSGFNKQYKNGITTVKLNYTFEVDGETIHERLVLINKGEEYKVLVVSMHPNEDVVIEYTKDY